MRSIDETDETSSTGAPGRSEWLPWAAAAALFVVATTLGWQNFTQRRIIADLVEGEERLETELAILRSEIDRTRADALLLATAQRVVGAPDAIRILLVGLGEAPEAMASTFLDPRTGRAVFYAAGLPQLPADQTYQLWFTGREGPVSGGIFDVDERGEASLVVESVPPPDGIAVWTVTVEPAGGVPQPTGTMVLKG